MAGEETRPIDTQVAKPVQAPNYVGMYSERVKAALEPYEYLLNYQKELGEEDLRKAQIQNFLFEHDEKNKELNESIRSHTADETIRNLAQETASKHEAEEERHNLVDEQHATRESILQQFRDQEIKRHDEATEEAEKKNLELTSSLHDADIRNKDANTEWWKTQTQIKSTEDQQRADDSQVVQEVDNYISGIKPEDLWKIDENPDIQHKIDDLRGKLHTVQGRNDFNQVVTSKQALGQSMADHKEVDNMSTQARSAFNEAMLKSDPNEKIQLRFNDALKTARQIQAQIDERSTWGPEAHSAERAAKATGSDPQAAFNAGHNANQATINALKKPPVEQKADSKMVQIIQKAMPQGDKEPDDVYNARTYPKALELEQLRDKDPDAYTKALENLKAGGATGAGTADNWAAGILGTKPSGSPSKGILGKPDSDVVPGGTSITPSSTTGTDQIRLASNRSMLPSGAPNYAAASDNEDLNTAFRNLWGDQGMA